MNIIINVFQECPINTYIILVNGKKICSETISDNYFFDDNEEIYKECYKSCKKCQQPGNVTNNNCNQCNDDYVFLNKTSKIPQNCYSKNEVFPYNINQYKYKLPNSEETVELVQEKLLNGFNTTHIDNGNDYIITQGQITYTITSTKNQKNNKNINVSTFDLNECENKLIEVYNISKNESLYILKIDNYIENLLTN